MEPTPQAAASDAVFSQLTQSYDLMKRTRPEYAGNYPEYASKNAYQNVPMLKRPFWGWEIAIYFFIEGISAGGFILCTVADFIDRERFRSLIRVSRFLSILLVVPCPPLLIIDLGRPERFHHMLRIVKRSSPMNIGAWALTGYGTLGAVAAALELPAENLPLGARLLQGVQRFLPKRLVSLLTMPFAYTMVSYPGVLLSTTANPAWAQTHFLGALFSASSLSSAAAALTLCANFTGDHVVHEAIEKFEDVTTAAEGAALVAYLAGAGRAARPVTHGKQSKLFWWGGVVAGLIAPALLRRSKWKPANSGLAPLLTLVGTFALKWAIVHAAQESALDRESASRNAPPETWSDYWGMRERNVPAA
jgi:formate-dependent nitrite reductase membrane component NrfD